MFPFFLYPCLFHFFLKAKGIIFDFNGTLFFDTHFHEQAWKEISARMGLRILTGKEIRENILGQTNQGIVEFLLGRKANKYEIETIGLEKEKLYRQICSNQPILNLSPGATDFLDFLKRNQTPITIATSSGMDNLEFFISKFGLSRWFDTSKIVFDDGSFLGKPEPGIYLRAANTIGLSPQDCIVFEDALSGILAASRAKIGKIIAIGSAGINHAIKKQGIADQIIPDFLNFDTNLL